MSKNIYAFPKLPKAGLANMLVPWAECFIWSKDEGLERIAPFWQKIRIGPFFRDERDKRQYQRFFITKGTITGLRRFLLLFTSKQVSAEIYRFSDFKTLNTQNTIVCFSEMHIGRLVGRHEEVNNELYRITRPKFWPTTLPKSFIAIHIRLGDFPQRLESSKQRYFRLPIEWYVEALQQLRIAMGNNLTAIIFSDGTDEELEQILKLENIIRSPYSEAISDLLAIAKSTVFITSYSSFSSFGAYLGQSPSLWYKGNGNVSGGCMDNGKYGSHELEWMPGQIFPPDFIELIDKRIELTIKGSNQ